MGCFVIQWSDVLRISRVWRSRVRVCTTSVMIHKAGRILGFRGSKHPRIRPPKLLRKHLLFLVGWIRRSRHQSLIVCVWCRIIASNKSALLILADINLSNSVVDLCTEPAIHFLRKVNRSNCLLSSSCNSFSQLLSYYCKYKAYIAYYQ